MRGCNNCIHRKKTLNQGEWKIICKKTDRIICSGTWGVHNDNHLDNYCSCDGKYYKSDIANDVFNVIGQALIDGARAEREWHEKI